MSRIVYGAMENPNLVLIEDVPIVKVGVTYKLSSGDYTATFDDVKDFVESQKDANVNAPRLAIGHPDEERFPRYTTSGEPAFGVFTNVRMSENGTTAIGDLAGVPIWLAEIISTAYPQRSMEGATDYTHPQNGRTYSLFIKAIALLGIEWPGIHCLDDLEIAFSAEGPSEVKVVALDSKEVAAMAATIVAQTNVEDVHRQVWNDFLTEDSGRYWWWVCSILVDPLEAIVEDEKGQLYKVAITLDAEGTASFGEPEPVKIEYTPDSRVDTETEASAAPQRRAQALAAAVADGRTIAAVYTSREASRPDNKEGAMSVMDKLKASLKLASDATDDDVAVAVENLTSEEPPTEDPATPVVTDDSEENTEDEESEEQVAATAAIPEGMMLVDKATFEATQANAQAAADDLTKRTEEQRAAVIAQAITDRKILPARKEHYEAAMKTDPEGTTHLLTASVEDGGLAPGLVPGAAPVGNGDQTNGTNQTASDLSAMFGDRFTKKEKS